MGHALPLRLPRLSLTGPERFPLAEGGPGADVAAGAPGGLVADEPGPTGPRAR